MLFTGCVLSKGFSVAVVVVQARQSTHWSFHIKTSDFSMKGSGGGGGCELC